MDQLLSVPPRLRGELRLRFVPPFRVRSATKSFLDAAVFGCMPWVYRFQSCFPKKGKIFQILVDSLTFC